MQAWEEKMLEREEGRRQGLQQGRLQGLEQGLEQGRRQGLAESQQKLAEEKVKIARKLKSADVQIDIIVKSTGLAKEQVEAL